VKSKDLLKDSSTSVGMTGEPMPIIKSAIKRMRQTATRRKANVQVKNAIKKDVRAVVDALAVKDVAATHEAFRAAVSEIDRAVKKGTLHKNTAARKKSRLNEQVRAALGAEGQMKKAPAAGKKAPAKTTAAKKAATKK
jgi:ribosomal protein S20